MKEILRLILLIIIATIVSLGGILAGRKYNEHIIKKELIKYNLIEESFQKIKEGGE